MLYPSATSPVRGLFNFLENILFCLLPFSFKPKSLCQHRKKWVTHCFLNLDSLKKKKKRAAVYAAWWEPGNSNPARAALIKDAVSPPWMFPNYSLQFTLKQNGGLFFYGKVYGEVQKSCGKQEVLWVFVPNPDGQSKATTLSNPRGLWLLSRTSAREEVSLETPASHAWRGESTGHATSDLIVNKHDSDAKFLQGL